MSRLLEILQAAGFPVWAVVVAFASVQVVGELTAIRKDMGEYILSTESRLVKLEERCLATREMLRDLSRQRLLGLEFEHDETEIPLP